MSRSAWVSLLFVACGGSPKAPMPDPFATPPHAMPDTAAPTPPTPPAPQATVTDAPASAAAIADAKAKTLAKHGDANKAAIERGVTQVAALWRQSDGDLAEFCVEQFAGTKATRDALFARLEHALEELDGNYQAITRATHWGSDVEQGPLLPVEGLMTTYDPGTRLEGDMFESKIAFAILLNFPATTLADRIRDASTYDRRMWAEVRLGGRFDARIPGPLAQAQSAAEAAGDAYIAGYNVWMHHVLGEGGERRFPSKKRLISHWNLRDELKANYAEKTDGLAKQRTIAKVMERIVTQSIPKAVIDNPKLDWNPFTNAVTAAAAGTIEPEPPADRTDKPETAREPDTRFELVRQYFLAGKAIDKYVPTAPTRIERAFAGAEIPESRVRAMLIEVLGSPLVKEVGKSIEARLGRPLEPHDLWFDLGKAGTPETELDKVTRKKYPTAAAFAKDLPNILRGLGFTPARAKHLAEKITVDPSRGAGHAMEARRRGDQAHLRTRVEAGGMDYKGYNIAVHELGHNVEQTFSLYDIDYTSLAGVPNTAFTEALAFLFQARDKELLGRARPAGDAERAHTLNAFWNTFEIAGSALVEIDTWHWLYDHPTATAAELRDATVKIARDVWNRYYAPVLGGKDSVLLGIYSHTISTPLYLFNYVLGHLIAFQVEEHVAGKDKATFAREFERVARLGRILPDSWMQAATGKPVSTEPLLAATKRALEKPNK